MNPSCLQKYLMEILVLLPYHFESGNEPGFLFIYMLPFCLCQALKTTSKTNKVGYVNIFTFFFQIKIFPFF